MKILYSIEELTQPLEKLRIQNKTVGFVPTMGALHTGHLSLVKLALQKTPLVVVSIFVNPTQFNDKEDLNKYPKNISEDLSLLQTVLRKTDIVFIPSTHEMYPEPDMRAFNFGKLDKVLEGAHRPGHFNGVAQIVSKLFNLVQPDFAFFGEKDLQQLIIVRKLSESLHLPVTIVGGKIIREPDGLAMSSRNQLLEEKERAEAPKIYQALKKAIVLSNSYTPKEVKAQTVEWIEQNSDLSIEYFEIVDEENLLPVKNWGTSKNIYGCIAVKAGKIRLIDNIKF